MENVKKRAKGDVERIIKEIEESKKVLKLTIKSGSPIPIADYDDKDHILDLEDIAKFRGTVISPEAILLHEVVEKWEGLTTRPRPDYKSAHQKALNVENQFEGHTRTESPPQKTVYLT